MSFFANNADWPLKPLKDVAHLKRGYDLPTQDRIEGEIPIFAANGKNGTHNEAKIKGPGVITGRSGTIGKVHFTEHDYWPLNTALYVTDFKGNDPKWVYYMLQAFKLDRFVEGAGVPTLNRNLVHDELIPLPPLAEQKRIAAILDKADAIRRKRQQAIQLADEFLRAVFLEMFGDPVTNPKGWDVLELHQVVDFIGGSTLPPTEEYIGQTKGIAAFKVGDMNSDGNDTFLITPREWAREYSRKHAYAPIGTIVIPKRGGAIGTNKKRITSVESVLDPNLMGINPKNKVSLEYLFYWFQMLDLSTISNGSSVPQLNKKDLAPLNILVADKDVHVRFDEIYRNVQATKQKFMSSLYLNELSFSGLSQKAFSGQL
ncbi:restriction endonuclease subunit S [Vibrio cholerae]